MKPVRNLSAPTVGTVPRNAKTRGKIMSKWSVWVGGGEVNDYHLTTFAEAEELAQDWKNKGYDDVAIEEINA